jgi:hypothetical protein
MLPSSLKKEIFKSLPKQVTIGNDTLSIYVDYADRVNVSEKLRSYPVVLTLHYFGDRRSDVESPLNDILEITSDGVDVIYTKGERERITLRINIHAKDHRGAEFHHRSDVVDAVVDELLLWYLKLNIPGIATRGRSEVAALDFLAGDGIARRRIDFYLAYTLSYQETVTTIETINYEVQQG